MIIVNSSLSSFTDEFMYEEHFIISRRNCKFELIKLVKLSIKMNKEKGSIIISKVGDKFIKFNDKYNGLLFKLSKEAYRKGGRHCIFFRFESTREIPHFLEYDKPDDNISEKVAEILDKSGVMFVSEGSEQLQVAKEFEGLCEEVLTYDPEKEFVVLLIMFHEYDDEFNFLRIKFQVNSDREGISSSLRGFDLMMTEKFLSIDKEMGKFFNKVKSIQNKKKGVCSFCKKKDARKKCSNCCDFYCNRECQIDDWKNHKQCCANNWFEKTIKN